jgi:hypothetical protein
MLDAEAEAAMIAAEMAVVYFMLRRTRGIGVICVL